MKAITIIGIVGLAASMAAAQAPAPQGRAGGQGRGGRAGGPPNQLQQALYDMADSIGMLRNAQEVDRIGSMNYWATGTITSGTQTCKVVDYKATRRLQVRRLPATPRRGRQGQPRLE